MSELLNEILADSRITALQDLRESHEGRAHAAQAKHKFNSKMFIAATAVAAIAGALILYGSGREVAESPESWSALLTEAIAAGWLRTSLFVIEVVALAGAAYAAEMMRETHAGSEWQAERRAAEIGRVDLFDTIMEVAAERGIEAERLAFEHFLDQQLNAQLTYHALAEVRHRKAAGRSVVVGALVAALIAATGASGVGGALWIAFAAFVGVLAPVVLNALQSWRNLNLDHQLSERYRAAWSELKRLSGNVDASRSAIAAGDANQARELVGKVHAVMRAENETWSTS